MSSCCCGLHVTDDDTCNLQRRLHDLRQLSYQVSFEGVGAVIGAGMISFHAADARADACCSSASVAVRAQNAPVSRPPAASVSRMRTHHGGKTQLMEGMMGGRRTTRRSCLRSAVRPHIVGAPWPLRPPGKRASGRQRLLHPHDAGPPRRNAPPVPPTGSH